MYKIVSGIAPSYLNVFEESGHEYNTRFRADGKFAVVRTQRTVGSRSFQSRGRVIWNSISADLKDLRFAGFSKQYEEILFQEQILDV